MTKFVSAIADPDNSILNAEQLELFEQYKIMRNSLINNIDQQLKQNVLAQINRFFSSLTGNLQTRFKHWFNYQLCEIDTLLMPCLKMAEFLKQHNMEEYFALSPDGKSFMLLFEDEQTAKKIINLLTSQYPGLSIQLTEVNK